MDKSGYLLLEDGAQFLGEALHGYDPSFGEAVFNTSHSGYQEICTDPSYCRQIIVFTAAHIGNVGINRDDMESPNVHVAGVVVRNLSPQPRNWRSGSDLSSWLRQANVPLLTGADTRAITLHLRQRGAMRAGLFPTGNHIYQALEQIKSSMDMLGADLVQEVTCSAAYDYSPRDSAVAWHPKDDGGEGLRVAVLDCGVKENILCELASRGCAVRVFPAQTTADIILDGGYQGVLLSNGPGDPAAVTYVISTVQRLIGKLPIFGICLGHQILALAAGMETYKLPFGHRGANHPIKRESDGLVEITSQNHGFSVRPEGLQPGWRISHINLNDGTVEGLEHIEYPIFSIQYHPEASPGPHDSLRYFDRFIEEMRHAQKR